MDFVKIIILSAVSFLVLFALSKFMGSRQISQLSFFDYVIGISIGSIAAEMATNIDLALWKGVLAMIIYAALDVLFELLSRKSIKARKFINGTPIILINNSKISKSALKKAKIELDDLITAARSAGYFDLSQIQTAIIEENGKISFRLDVESGSDGQPFNIIQAYQSGWAKALEYSTYGGYSGVSFEDLSAYWGAQCTILDDYSSCEITNDGENTVYTFSFEDSESGLEINEPDDGSVFQSKTRESQMKKVVVLDKDNMPIYYIASGVTEGNYGGKKQTTTYSTRFDWSFENVEIDFSDLSDYLYLATGEKKQ